LHVRPKATSSPPTIRASSPVTNVLHHLQKGHFYGHPSSLSVDPNFKGSPKTTTIEELEQDAHATDYLFSPMTAWADRFPNHASTPPAGNSAHLPANVPRRHLQSSLHAAQLDKVDGQFQGACYPFMVHDDLVGANREAFGARWNALCRHHNRGWGKGVMGLRAIK